ncbi:MAG: hypothetical protein EOP86_13565 [Verrucomicrobiaceae bacterium]|nr:MAG: hypothetical protein EOP86_13565 [Verrucomicrobiaceae bacterium]
MSGSPACQRLAALRLAGTGTVREIRALLSAARALPPGPGARLAITVLLRRWLDLQPAEALEYARLGHPQEFPELLAARASQDFEAARKVMGTLKDAPVKLSAWQALTRVALLRADSALAWEMIRQKPDSQWREQGTVMLPLMVALAEKDTGAALQALETLPGDSVECLRNALARVLMRQDPESAWDWILENTAHTTHLVSSGLSVLCHRDPAKAFTFLATLAAEQTKRQWVARMMDGYYDSFPVDWRGKNPQAVADGLSLSPLSSEDKQWLASDLFSQDPARARPFWELLGEKKKAQVLQPWLWRWRQLDPARAKEWIDQQPKGAIREAAEDRWRTMERLDSGTTAASLIAAIESRVYPAAEDSRLSGLKLEDLNAMMAVLPGSNYGGGGLFARAGQDQPATMAAWLETVEISKEAAKGVGEFTARWAQDAPREASAWVSRLPPGLLAETAAENTAREFHMADPVAAAAWISTLSGGSVREAAQRAVASLAPDYED